MKIKVCGLRDPENIKAVAALGPDYVGFICYGLSPRYVAELPGDVLKALPANIRKTAVFVNESAETINSLIDKYAFDVIQLHGDESAEFSNSFRNRVTVFKAFGLNDDFNFDQLTAYENKVDYFLFDTKTAAYGGSGKTFNWDMLNNYKLAVPFFLSGGVSLDNMDEIKKIDHPQFYGVDLNSRFETAPGVKDISKLKQAFDIIRNKILPMKYGVNEHGYYGDFGGAYIPEMLYPNVEELRQQYLSIINDAGFKAEFNDLLKNYVGRPSPLYHAKRYSEKYGASIFFKREDLNHTGSHKINNAIGQILLAKRLGKKRIIAETGAGQHGVATATVCALMGIECVVYMGEIDMARQAPNVSRMKMLGATVKPASSGSKTLKDATNEAMRDWIANPVDTHYIIGSVVGPYPYPDMVARFQSVISEETKKQLLEQTGKELPEYVMACVGGGSNAMGMFYHFLDDEQVKLIAVEAAGKGVDSGHSAATTFLGHEGVLHGSRTILMQTPDGQVVEPYSISAGLDYPGIGPQHAHLYKINRAQYTSITDDEALQAGLLCSQMEGIIPAIETAHALAQLEKMTFKSDDTVVICISGRGDKDLDTYIKYFNF
ncbi:bifunctional phosphoribosylanthranilate isomerase/tryptophan synthase subunit beta [Mucilaginibacter sp.]|uniref:bifunctional phosphoribosylanthranilate isomerase/tryptophan synthase subunit beta n=1 Tax=Mucilaginibacter sp. TaxID=1882438 RepID=UPI0025CE7748|nr:bifunctional phosphoribosylanthranilate isomerase/tryptophan synthase subunit beta [Mucilaginibacter sp.]